MVLDSKDPTMGGTPIRLHISKNVFGMLEQAWGLTGDRLEFSHCSAGRAC